MLSTHLVILTMNKYYTIEIKDDATVRINKKEWDEFKKWKELNRFSNVDIESGITQILSKYNLNKSDLGKMDRVRDKDFKDRVKTASMEILTKYDAIGITNIAKMLGVSPGVFYRVRESFI